MERHDFFILVTREAADPARFRLIVSGSERRALGKGLVVDVPPPPREIRVVTSHAAFTELLNENFKQVIGLLFNEALVISANRIDPKYLRETIMAARKAATKSPFSRAHGVGLGLYVTEADLSVQAELLCQAEAFAKADGVPARVEILECEEVLDAFFRSQLRRLAAYEASLRAGLFD